MAKRRKVGNLLALAIMSSLIERPMHPYEMASVLRHRNKDQDMKINWGSFYTVVQNLEKHGFIEATETVREGRRPERTVYAITEAGRTELVDWMRELVGNPEQEHPKFRAALSVLGVLDPDEAIGLLEQRVRRLDAEIADQQAALREVGREIPRMFLIEAEYYLALRTAEADWIRTLLAGLADGSFPGMDAWRAFHKTGRLPDELFELSQRGRPKD